VHGPLREIVNAIFYVLRGGIAWRLLPTDLPPRTTVYRWFALWRDTGLSGRVWFDEVQIKPAER
jgi:transposase